MLRALALDCSAAAAVEQVCDQIEVELQGHVSRLLLPLPVQPGVRGPAPGAPGPPAGPAGRPPAGGAVRQRQPHPHPPQVGDRHFGGRPTDPSNQLRAAVWAVPPGRAASIESQVDTVEFRELLKTPGPVLLDGGMGTMLQARGLSMGEWPRAGRPGTPGLAGGHPPGLCGGGGPDPVRQHLRRQPGEARPHRPHRGGGGPSLSGDRPPGGQGAGPWWPWTWGPPASCWSPLAPCALRRRWISLPRRCAPVSRPGRT